MSLVFQILFAPIGPFVGHPELACLMAALLSIASGLLMIRTGSFRFGRDVPLLAAAAAWWGFGAWEAHAMMERWDIRIDLLLIAPVLEGITVWGLWNLVFGWRSRPVREGEPAAGAAESDRSARRDVPR